MIFNLLYPESVRCRKEQKNNMVILYQYANAVIFLCSRVSGQPIHATAPALMSLEATQTIVRGRQPRSGLMCILCKLMFLCSRGKRQAQTLYFMSLCSSVSRVSGQRTKQQTSNGTACHITTLIALFLSQIYPLTLVHKLIICKFAITCHLC